MPMPIFLFVTLVLSVDFLNLFQFLFTRIRMF